MKNNIATQVNKIRHFNFVYSISIFVLSFSFLFFQKQYYIAPSVNWIDTWVGLGYGQVFPQEAFSNDYYKESRIISIIWEWFVTRFPSDWYENLVMILISLLAVLITLSTRKKIKNPILNIFVPFCIIGTPLIWGDYAGGGDYYNTFGNFLVVFIFYRLIIRRSAKTLDNIFIVEISILLSILVLEIPSGIMAAATFQIYFLILYQRQIEVVRKHSSRAEISRILNLNLKYFFLQVLGLLTLVLFEITMLLSLKQSPSRLLPGAKILIKSLRDPTFVRQWWTQLPFGNLQSLPALVLFLVIFLSLITLLFSTLLKIRRNSFESEFTSDTYRSKIFLLSTIFIFLIIFLLQVSGKTLALSMSYFTTQLILVGFLAIHQTIASFNQNPKILNRILTLLSFILFSSLLSHLSTQSKLFLGFIIAASTAIFFFSSKLIFKSRSFGMFLISIAVVGILSCLFSVSDIGLRTFSSESNSNYNVCLKARLQQRSDFLKISEVIDNLIGPRGTVMMGANDQVLRNSIVSDCNEFNGAKMESVLLSLQSMGFMPTANLGSIKDATENDKSSYAYSRLSNIFNRQIEPSSCYVEWEGEPATNSRQENILGVNLYLVSNCFVQRNRKG